MNKSYVEDNEILYRAILRNMPNAVDNGRLMPAVFMDKNGASVERDGKRKPQDIIQTLCQRFNQYGKVDKYMGAAKISAKDCRSIPTHVAPIGNMRNIFHAEIHDSEEEVYIPMVKAMMLVERCELCMKE